MRLAFLITLIGLLSGFGGYFHGFHKGAHATRLAALNTNPPSEELELACAGLWVGEQNKKYFYKDQKK